MTPPIQWFIIMHIAAKHIRTQILHNLVHAGLPFQGRRRGLGLNGPGRSHPRTGFPRRDPFRQDDGLVQPDRNHLHQNCIAKLLTIYYNDIL